MNVEEDTVLVRCSVFSPGGVVSEGEAWTLCRPGIHGLGGCTALPEEEREASGGRERGEASAILHFFLL